MVELLRYENPSYQEEQQAAGILLTELLTSFNSSELHRTLAGLSTFMLTHSGNVVAVAVLSGFDPHTLYNT